MPSDKTIWNQRALDFLREASFDLEPNEPLSLTSMSSSGYESFPPLREPSAVEEIADWMLEWADHGTWLLPNSPLLPVVVEEEENLMPVLVKQRSLNMLAMTCGNKPLLVKQQSLNTDATTKPLLVKQQSLPIIMDKPLSVSRTKSATTTTKPTIVRRVCSDSKAQFRHKPVLVRLASGGSLTLPPVVTRQESSPMLHVDDRPDTMAPRARSLTDVPLDDNDDTATVETDALSEATPASSHDTLFQWRTRQRLWPFSTMIVPRPMVFSIVVHHDAPALVRFEIMAGDQNGASLTLHNEEILSTIEGIQDAQGPGWKCIFALHQGSSVVKVSSAAIVARLHRLLAAAGVLPPESRLWYWRSRVPWALKKKKTRQVRPTLRSAPAAMVW